MAVSLAVAWSFTSVTTIQAAEEISTTDNSLYQKENQTQEKNEVQTESSVQLETSAVITESTPPESVQPESTQESVQLESTQESTSLETESTIETASEHEETTVGEDVSETITETAIETTVEESPEESSGDEVYGVDEVFIGCLS